MREQDLADLTFYIKTKENNYFVIDSKCPMGKYDDFIKPQTEKEKKLSGRFVEE